jgi:hypothetical protein
MYTHNLSSCGILAYSFLDFDYVPIKTSIAVAEGYPKLDFKPFVLRKFFLAATLLFFSACLGGIITLILIAHNKTHYLRVHTLSTSLAFRYVPVAIGTLTIIWWRSIMTALARTTQYISMAGQNNHEKAHHRLQRTLLNEYATTAFNPANVMGVARNGHWLLFICLVLQVMMMILLVPLKASFVLVTAGGHGWTVAVLCEVGYALIAIYVCLLLATTYILARLWDRETGLKWDPVTIADQVALVQGSNIFPMLEGLEFATPRECSSILATRSSHFGTLRLGYWMHRCNGTIWYGLACTQRLPDTSNYNDTPILLGTYSYNSQTAPQLRMSNHLSIPITKVVRISALTHTE